MLLLLFVLFDIGVFFGYFSSVPVYLAINVTPSIIFIRDIYDDMAVGFAPTASNIADFIR